MTQDSEECRLLLKPIEAAHILNVSPATLAAWRVRRSDGPPFYRVGGRAIRYPFEDLKEWLEKQRRTSTAG
ncbi:helix-turn-helix transcriptional regulator [Hwanghaeella sp. 1Z406]|uniref:helix-turn-helix transcriptional regulator n=1 Tax=Hwanghaeella sp. 1Z406 TaxID=3402811 RepID=UPI003B66F21A